MLKKIPTVTSVKKTQKNLIRQHLLQDDIIFPPSLFLSIILQNNSCPISYFQLWLKLLFTFFLYPATFFNVALPPSFSSTEIFFFFFFHFWGREKKSMLCMMDSLYTVYGYSVYYDDLFPLADQFDLLPQFTDPSVSTIQILRIRVGKAFFFFEGGGLNSFLLCPIYYTFLLSLKTIFPNIYICMCKYI